MLAIYHGITWTKLNTPDSKVHGANMGPTWVLSAPDGPHVGPMNLAIRDSYSHRQGYHYDFKTWEDCPYYWPSTQGIQQLCWCLCCLVWQSLWTNSWVASEMRHLNADGTSLQWHMVHFCCVFFWYCLNSPISFRVTSQEEWSTCLMPSHYLTYYQLDS